AVVATGASVVAGHIARRDALAEALRSAHVVGNTVFAPLLPAVMTGSADATRRLDNAVRIRSRDGSLVRVKVWKRDGTVIYSDDHDAIGRKFPLHDDVAATIDGQKNSAAISDLKDPENITENGYQRLIEVYTPLVLDDGTKLAFELYSTDARVLASEKELRSELVPFALLALLILLVTQLPVSVWLVRRVGRAQEERSRLLNNALAASGRERRAIARDLHDGVVPDLAAAGFAVGTLGDTLPADANATSHRLVGTISDIVQRSVYSLRTLMIDLYPPDLTAAGLSVAVENLTAKLRSAAGITVLVTVALDTDPSPATAATIYRCVRECLENIAKHARASRAELTLTGDDVTVSLRVQDDGVGLPATGIDRRAEGHFGLQLLRDAVEDLGGHLKVNSSSNGGTSIEVEVPLLASSAADRTGETPAPRRRTRWPRLRRAG
ncbi:MAG: two-component system, NarL family, sensor kinase, partial [Pseudonocardiales bacterium]|nr:two-component system, NarL family, sensor kinase [Pseudonocardiales bacterium]